MAGNSPLDKYNNTNSRVSSSVSTGNRAHLAAQPQYSHPPVQKPNYETTKPRLVWSNDNPRPNTNSNPTNRIPLAARVTPLGLGIVIGGAIGNALLSKDEKSSLLGKDYKPPTPEENADYLTKEIKKYDPNFTFKHPKDAKGVQFLANQLHYEKARYYNRHKNSCCAGFDPALYNQTIKDLDARTELLAMINGSSGDIGKYSNDTQERIKELEYQDYKANGGTLSYNDWLISELNPDNTLGDLRKPYGGIKDFEHINGNIIPNPKLQVLTKGQKATPLVKGERYIWAIDKKGNLRIGVETEVAEGQRLGHPSLVGKDGARSGGEIKLNDETGKWRINDRSGRFSRGRTKAERTKILDNVQKLFIDAGLDVGVKY